MGGLWLALLMPRPNFCSLPLPNTHAILWPSWYGLVFEGGLVLWDTLSWMAGERSGSYHLVSPSFPKIPFDYDELSYVFR